jgi:hypothetical protein
MSGSKARSRVAAKQKVPRIRPAEASAIFKSCEQLLEESRTLLLNLRSSGISELLGRMDDRSAATCDPARRLGRTNQSAPDVRHCPGFGCRTNRGTECEH